MEKTRTARAVAWLVLLASENVEVDLVALTYRDGSEAARIEERPDMRRSCPSPDARSLFSTERSCERFNRGRRARAEAELYGQSAGCVFELGDSVGRYIFKECNGSRIERLKNTG